MSQLLIMLPRVRVTTLTGHSPSEMPLLHCHPRPRNASVCLSTSSHGFLFLNLISYSNKKKKRSLFPNKSCKIGKYFENMHFLIVFKAFQMILWWELDVVLDVIFFNRIRSSATASAVTVVKMLTFF